MGRSTAVISITAPVIPFFCASVAQTNAVAATRPRVPKSRAGARNTRIIVPMRQAVGD